MDILFLLGQLLSLAVLGYGAWLCCLPVGKYDDQSPRAEIAALRAARAGGHSGPAVEYQAND